MALDHQPAAAAGGPPDHHPVVRRGRDALAVGTEGQPLDRPAARSRLTVAPVVASSSARRLPSRPRVACRPGSTRRPERYPPHVGGSRSCRSRRSGRPRRRCRASRRSGCGSGRRGPGRRSPDRIAGDPARGAPAAAVTRRGRGGARTARPASPWCGPPAARGGATAPDRRRAGCRSAPRARVTRRSSARSPRRAGRSARRSGGRPKRRRPGGSRRRACAASAWRRRGSRRRTPAGARSARDPCRRQRRAIPRRR